MEEARMPHFSGSIYSMVLVSKMVDLRQYSSPPLPPCCFFAQVAPHPSPDGVCSAPVKLSTPIRKREEGRQRKMEPKSLS